MTEGTTTVLTACLERLRAGDPRAREALIARTRERLERLTRRLLNDFARLRRFEETDDVLQNALLRLLRRLESQPPGSAAEFFALAAREIRRELIDLARHHFGPRGAGRHEVALPPAPSSEDTPAPAADPSEQTHEPGRLARWTELHEQVERLPEEERAVVDLIWYHGLTRAEAAAVLGVSEPTVKRRWLAARLRLQSVLKLDGNEF